MNAAKLYAKFDAECMIPGGAMPRLCKDAFMSACDNVTGFDVDSELFKAAAIDGIQFTAAFAENESVRDWFESQGYTW